MEDDDRNKSSTCLPDYEKPIIYYPLYSTPRMVVFLAAMLQKRVFSRQLARNLAASRFRRSSGCRSVRITVSWDWSRMPLAR